MEELRVFLKIGEGRLDKNRARIRKKASFMSIGEQNWRKVRHIPIKKEG